VTKFDTIQNASLRIRQRDDMFRFNSDTTALIDFMIVKKQDRVLDIGTNNGVLLLAAMEKGAKEGVGIDVFEEAIALAKENAKENLISNVTFEIVALNQFTSAPFDVILCNPPYYKDSGKVNANPLIHAARQETYLPLEELIKNVKRLLKDKGRFQLVHRAERLGELMRLLDQQNLIVKRIRFIHHDITKNATGVCIEAVLNANDGSIVMPPILYRKEE